MEALSSNKITNESYRVDFLKRTASEMRESGANAGILLLHYLNEDGLPFVTGSPFGYVPALEIVLIQSLVRLMNLEQAKSFCDRLLEEAEYAVTKPRVPDHIGDGYFCDHIPAKNEG